MQRKRKSYESLVSQPTQSSNFTCRCSIECAQLTKISHRMKRARKSISSTVSSWPQMASHRLEFLANLKGKSLTNQQSHWVMMTVKTPCYLNWNRSETFTSSIMWPQSRHKELTIYREDGKNLAHWIDSRPSLRFNSTRHCKSRTRQDLMRLRIKFKQKWIPQSRQETCSNH